MFLLKSDEQLFEQHVSFIVNKKAFDFLKMGQTAVLLCFYSDDGCGHFVTISFYGRLQSEESFQITFSALTNQRPVFRRGDQSEA